MLTDYAKYFPSFTLKRVSAQEHLQIQDLIISLKDFFLLCEGLPGSATHLLNACPPNKKINQDKLVLILQTKTDFPQTIALVDLIRDYPTANIWTIGYLLVHPQYQRQRIGQQWISALCHELGKDGITHLRCVVQAKNTRALQFWLHNGFQFSPQADPNTLVLVKPIDLNII
jgi:ribosomal protein S18 acetylase RimI-like enzyme